MSLKRLYVTLIEMMLVLTILLIIAGVVAIASKKAFDEQRFRSEVSLIVNKLRFAQDLMLIYKGDVEVHFEGGGAIPVSFWLTSQHLKEGLWKKEIEHKYTFKMIRAIGFGESTDKGTLGQLDLVFKSNGALMSKGVLRIATGGQNRGALERHVLLYGRPQAIIDVAHYPADFKGELKKEENEDAHLTRQTVEDVREKN